MKSTSNYRLCRCRCRCKINYLIKKNTSTSIFFIALGPSIFQTFFSPPGLLFFSLYLALVSARSFSFILFAGLDFCFSKIANYLKIFLISKITLDAHLVIFTAKLQSYHQILALSLTARYIAYNG